MVSEVPPWYADLQRKHPPWQTPTVAAQQQPRAAVTPSPTTTTMEQPQPPMVAAQEMPRATVTPSPSITAEAQQQSPRGIEHRQLEPARLEASGAASAFAAPQSRASFAADSDDDASSTASLPCSAALEPWMLKWTSSAPQSDLEDAAAAPGYAAAAALQLGPPAALVTRISYHMLPH